MVAAASRRSPPAAGRRRAVASARLQRRDAMLELGAASLGDRPPSRARARRCASSARSTSSASARRRHVGELGHPPRGARSASRSRVSSTSVPSRRRAARAVVEHRRLRKEDVPLPRLEQLERPNDVLAVRGRRAAEKLVLQLRLVLRTGKCSTSNGNHSRTRRRPLPSTSWFPTATTASGTRAVRDLDLRVVRAREIGGRPRADRHPLEERLRRRAGGRTAARGRGRRRTRPGTAARISWNEPPRGHQNSSASLGSPSRRRARSPRGAPSASPTRPAAARPPPRGARRRGRPRACSAQHLGRTVDRAVIRGDHEVDAAGEVVAEPRLDEVHLVADDQRHRDAHQLPRARPTRERPHAAARSGHRRRRLERADALRELVEPPADADQVAPPRAPRRRPRTRRPRRRSAAGTRAGLRPTTSCGARPGPACPRASSPARERRRAVVVAAERASSNTAGTPPALGCRGTRARDTPPRAPRRPPRCVELLDRAPPQRSLALELRCRADRESGGTSSGYQPRIGTKSVPPTEWLPSTTSASGWARCTTLRNGRQGLRGSFTGACAASRSVIRSWNGRPSSGTGTKWRTNDWTSPYRRGIVPSTSGSEPPRGHQNSSTSPLITQSAPCSVAARRAMRVTHSRCRNGPSGSRITRTRPSRSYRASTSWCRRSTRGR